MSAKQIYPTTGVGERVEYALVLDCRLQGCKAKIGYEHTDHGRVQRPLSAWQGVQMGARPTINGHAARLVKRTVVLPDWEDAG